MTARRLGEDSILVDAAAAREACRLLVNMMCELADIPLEDLQPAAALALKAFGLLPDFPFQVLINELQADMEHCHVFSAPP
jgi:hypothetical protein